MPRFVALPSSVLSGLCVQLADGEAEAGLAQGRNGKEALPHHWLEQSHMAAPSSKGSWGRCSPFPAGRRLWGSILPVCQDHFQPREFITLAFSISRHPLSLYPLLFCPYKCLLLTEVYSFPMFLISCWPLLPGTELWCSVHHCLLRILDRAWPAEGT